MIILVVREAVSPLSPGADLNKTAIKGSANAKAKGKRSVCSNSRKKLQRQSGKNLVKIKSKPSVKVFGVKTGLEIDSQMIYYNNQG